MSSDDYRLLFACSACSDNNHYDCVHLTVGAWCPCACPWLWRQQQGGNDDGTTEA